MAAGGVSNPNPVVHKPVSRSTHPEQDLDPVVVEIFDIIRDIKDPEHPHTLEELNVVHEDCITVVHHHKHNPHEEEDEELWIKIEFTPTVPHCSLATLIGLCLRVKLEQTLQQKFKLDICVSEGTHSIAQDVDKQINDKERVAAALENPSLMALVEDCIKEVEY